ncbi:MAG: bifunctional riboflavin kinase/FAD synthetase [Candidatus Promineifilaceae bacterium]
MTQSFQRVSSLAEVQEKSPTFLAVGVFDGVHRGHQALLQEMAAAARAAKARTAVLTFFPHPITVIRPQSGRLYLSTLEERVVLLREQGISLVITHPFNETVRQTRAADFVNQLCHHLNMVQLWGGHFSLGYNREGDLPFLQALGEKKGFSVHPYQSLLEWEGERISSSRIRRELAAGNITAVNGCLGRPYSLTGTVIRGEGRGRTIGIPTANLHLWEEQYLPANGVYATVATVGGRSYTAATNIGVRPTVGGHDQTVEAHLLDFDGDLYEQEVTLAFIGRIRDEQKFPGLDALVTQIHADIAQTRKIVNSKQ